MDISAMFATMGSSLFYGGIIGCFTAVIILLIMIPVFKSGKKKLKKKIEDEIK